MKTSQNKKERTSRVTPKTKSHSTYQKKAQKQEINKIFTTEKELLNKFLKNLYWDLYLDLYLMFSLTIVFSIVLILTERNIGIIFLVFGMICCSVISINYYVDIKNEIEKVMKDIQFLLRK